MAAPIPAVVHTPPAVKVGGRRLSLSSRPRRPAPTEAKPDIVPDVEEVADYPRPSGHGPEAGDHIHTHGSHGHAAPLPEPNSAIPLPPSHNPNTLNLNQDLVQEGHDDGDVKKERHREKDKWQTPEAAEQERKARESMNRKMMKTMRNRKEFVGGPPGHDGRIQQPQGRGLM